MKTGWKIATGFIGAVTAIYTGYKLAEKKESATESNADSQILAIPFNKDIRPLPQGTKRLKVEFGNSREFTFRRKAESEKEKDTKIVETDLTSKDGRLFDEQGYDVDGFNSLGFNRSGRDRDGYNKYGYDVYGFDRNGLDRKGFDKHFYNVYGVDRAGLSTDAYKKRMENVADWVEKAISNLKEQQLDYAMFNTRKAFEEMLRLVIGHYLGPDALGADMLKNLKIIENRIGVFSDEELRKAHNIRKHCNKIHDFKIEESLNYNQAYFSVMQTEQMIKLVSEIIIDGERDELARKKIRR